MLQQFFLKQYNIIHTYYDSHIHIHGTHATANTNTLRTRAAPPSAQQLAPLPSRPGHKAQYSPEARRAQVYKDRMTPYGGYHTAHGPAAAAVTRRHTSHTKGSRLACALEWVGGAGEAYRGYPTRALPRGRTRPPALRASSHTTHKPDQQQQPPIVTSRTILVPVPCRRVSPKRRASEQHPQEAKDSLKQRPQKRLKNRRSKRNRSSRILVDASCSQPFVSDRSRAPGGCPHQACFL